LIKCPHRIKYLKNLEAYQESSLWNEVDRYKIISNKMFQQRLVYRLVLDRQLAAEAPLAAVALQVVEEDTRENIL
jgi:hypothetical protein